MRSSLTSPAALVGFGKECEAICPTLLPASEEPSQGSDRARSSGNGKFIRSGLEFLGSGFTDESGEWLDGLPTMFQLLAFGLGEIVNGRRQRRWWPLRVWGC